MNESPGVHLPRLDRGKANKSNKVNKSFSVMKTAIVFFSCGDRSCMSLTDKIHYSTLRGAKVGFCINSKPDARIFGAYSTCAIDVTGAASESLTNWPQLFFPRLLGYLAGEISEAEIIAEICA